MFFRIAQFLLDPALAEEAIGAYQLTGVPRVRSFAGNLDCYLLTPVVAGERYLACTVWESEAHAKAYESSGAAQEVAGLLRPAFIGPPELKTYERRSSILN